MNNAYCIITRGQGNDEKKNVNRDYVKVLKRRYRTFRSMRGEYFGCSLPLYVMSWEARKGRRPWSDVELLLSKFPPCMAKEALLWGEGWLDWTPLHFAAIAAPLSTIGKMLDCSPEAVHVQDGYGRLPLHHAAIEKNAPVVEALIKVYPRGIFVHNKKKRDHILIMGERNNACNEFTYKVASNDKETLLVIRAMMRGLILGLCGENCKFSSHENSTNAIILDKFESIIFVISRLMVESEKPRLYILPGLHDFLNFYERKNFYYCDIDNVSEMLLQLYYMVAQIPDINDDCVLSKTPRTQPTSIFEDIFGCSSLGTRILTLTVQCQLLMILERYK